MITTSIIYLLVSDFPFPFDEINLVLKRKWTIKLLCETLLGLGAKKDGCFRRLSLVSLYGESWLRLCVQTSVFGLYSTTLVKICPYKPPAWLIRAWCSLYFPMAIHSFPVPSNLRPQLWPYTFIACWIMQMRHHWQISNGKPKVAREAYIREGWNPVCWHGNKTVKLNLWKTSQNFIKIALLKYCFLEPMVPCIWTVVQIVWGTGWFKW